MVLFDEPFEISFDLVRGVGKIWISDRKYGKKKKLRNFFSLFWKKKKKRKIDTTLWRKFSAAQNYVLHSGEIGTTDWHKATIKCNGGGQNWNESFFFFSFLLQAKKNLILGKPETVLNMENQLSNWHEWDVIYNRRELNNW